MQELIDKSLEEVSFSSNWSQDFSLLTWDEVDCQVSTSRMKRRRLRLDGRSYSDFLLRNTFKLSNPNRSGAGIFSTISRSNNSSHLPNETENSSSILDTFTQSFINMLYDKAADENDEQAYDFVSRFLASFPREGTMLWIQKVFNENCEDEKTVVGLLRLFLDFGFDEISPVAPTIAACCKNHKSYAVKSAAFSLLGHWCNKQALSIINAFDEPNEMMLRIKYRKLKDIISAKCTI